MIARAAGAFVSLRRERMLASGPDGPALGEQGQPFVRHVLRRPKTRRWSGAG